MDYPCHALCAINKCLLYFKIGKIGKCSTGHTAYRSRGSEQVGACWDNTPVNKALCPFPSLN